MGLLLCCEVITFATVVVVTGGDVKRACSTGGTVMARLFWNNCVVSKLVSSV